MIETKERVLRGELISTCGTLPVYVAVEGGEVTLTAYLTSERLGRGRWLWCHLLTTLRRSGAPVAYLSFAYDAPDHRSVTISIGLGYLIQVFQKGGLRLSELRPAIES